MPVEPVACPCLGAVNQIKNLAIGEVFYLARRDEKLVKTPCHNGLGCCILKQPSPLVGVWAEEALP